ncbi:MAG: four helix bundle protein [Bacteroidales bacterium]|jgi:four helix bundle protein|nr:four helix bundle protein [Bacteroidales bacterium]
METQNTYPLLKESLDFTARVINYSEILEQEKKKTIALKLMHSGIKINSYLFEAKTAIRIDDINLKLQKAKISTEEALYWLKQCVKSNYLPNDSNVFDMGIKLSENISKSIKP